MQYRGLELDSFQETAIRHLQEGRNVLVSAPTGTGKTLVADWIVDEALNTGRKVIYTAPIKALSNQKFRDYTRLWGPERVGLVTGDLVIRRDAPCRVMTTEILRNMLLGDEDLSDLLAVIIDEIHFLDDRERGTVWEEVLIYLPKHVQIVGLSATISNLDDFAEWMGHVRGTAVEVIVETRRAVPLTFHYASVDTGLCDPGTYQSRARRVSDRVGDFEPRGRHGRDRGRSRPPARRTREGDIHRMLVEHKLLPYLYFVFSRRDTERFARFLGQNVQGTLLDSDEKLRMAERLIEATSTLGSALEPELQALYAKGIAFHHAGLHVQLKALVEELYEQRLIKALFCTSTFALGINMPARTVVFDGLHKFDGVALAPLSTRQFMQKAGRAGRRGMDDVGHVVIRLDVAEFEEAKPLLERYRKGAYEPVRSRFSLSWNSIVNLLAQHSSEAIRELIEKSFLSWHTQRQAEVERARAEKLESDAGGQNRNKHRDLKEARRLVRRAEAQQGRVWGEFEERVAFLQSIGYLDEERKFNAGARALAHLQIAEVLVAELLLAGTFEDLDAPTWFGVLCGLVSEFPRSADLMLRPTKDDRKLAQEIGKIAASELVREAERISRTPVIWGPEWIAVGRAWANGSKFDAIAAMVASPTDVAGDIVGTFRRAKDLAGQLREVYRTQPARAEVLAELVRKVTRDEVEVVD